MEAELLLETKKYALLTLGSFLILAVAAILVPLLRGTPPDARTYSAIFIAAVLALALIVNSKSRAWSRV